MTDTSTLLSDQVFQLNTFLWSVTRNRKCRLVESEAGRSADPARRGRPSTAYYRLERADPANPAMNLDTAVEDPATPFDEL